MAVCNIIIAPNPILKQMCTPIDFNTDKPLIHDLRDTLNYLGKSAARGLSAPQIGHTKRAFAMWLDEKLVVICNPVITVSTGERDVQREGCLSFPWINTARVERAVYISGHYFKHNQTRIEFHLAGDRARVFQHELDHLDGITIDKRRREI